MGQLIQLSNLNLLFPYLNLHLPQLHLPVIFGVLHGISLMGQLVIVVAILIELRFQVRYFHCE